MPKLTVTTLGAQKVLSSAQNGFGPVTISEIGISATAVTEGDPGRTSIPSEIKRLTSISGGATDPTTLHVYMRDTSSDAYSVRTAGLYLNDGTLFAYVTSSTPLLTKTALAVGYMSFDHQFVGEVKPDMVDFGDTTFGNGNASTGQVGAVRLATLAETAAGLDTQLAVTPAGLKAVTDNLAVVSDYNTVNDPTLKPGLHSRNWIAGGVEACEKIIAFPKSDEEGFLATRLVWRINSGDASNPDTSGLQLEADYGSGFVPWGPDGTMPSLSRVVTEIGLQRPYSTAAQATAGTDNASCMTPLRVAAAIDSRRAYATQAQAEGGTSTTGVITPLRLRQGVGAQFDANTDISSYAPWVQMPGTKGVRFCTGLAEANLGSGAQSVTFVPQVGAGKTLLSCVAVIESSPGDASVIKSVKVNLPANTVTINLTVGTNGLHRFSWIGISI